MRAVIIDDEQDNIDTLIWELNNQEVSVEVVKSFTNSVEGYEYLESNEIDVLFLDIEMPHMNGFELLAGLKDINFEVIFVTAYNEYAIEAFKHSALDYLLKPVIEENLAAALQKLSKTQRKEVPLRERLSALFNEQKVKKKLPITNKNSILLLEPEDIVYCESDGNYTKIFYQKDNEISRVISSKTLKFYQETLNPVLFIKIHRSYLVNRNCVTELHYDDGRAFLMVNETIELPISRSQKEEVFKVFG